MSRGTPQSCFEAEPGKDATPVNVCYCVPQTCVPSPQIMDVRELEGDWYAEADTAKAYKSTLGKGYNNNFMFQCVFCGTCPYCFLIWFRQCGGFNCEGWSNTFNNALGSNITVVDKDTIVYSFSCLTSTVMRKESVSLVSQQRC